MMSEGDIELLAKGDAGGEHILGLTCKLTELAFSSTMLICSRLILTRVNLKVFSNFSAILL